MKNNLLYPLKTLCFIFFCCLLDSAIGQEIQMIAHRGGVVEGTYSENSLAALQAAVDRGYWMIEVDIRESLDGKIVVHHDSDFRRFYGVDKKVSEMKWEEMQKLRTQKEGQRPLLFQEVAEASKGKLQLMLDTKPPAHSPEFYQDLEEILEENELLEHAYVIGTKEAREYFKGKARVGTSFMNLMQAADRGEPVKDLYFLFMHGNELKPHHLQIANALGVPIVPSVNLFHYKDEEPIQGGNRDVSWLRNAGVTQFQIDSEYDSALRQPSISPTENTLQEENLAEGPTERAMNVMTFNIRYPNPGDSANYWPHRKHMVASMIRYHQADLIGIQEAFRSQLDELTTMLPEYKWIGVCRTSGDQHPDPDNEFSAILYRTSRFKPLQEETFWLSETPSTAGVAGWDAALPRIVTWGRFIDLRTQKEFFHFNTHFDHRGKEARKESAHLLLKKVKEIAGSMPTLITGDFNARPTSVPYQILVDPNREDSIQDAIHLSEQPHHGPDGTGTNGFKIPGVPGSRIDYVFVKNGVKVLTHAILAESWGGRLPSDHLPVLVKCEIP